MTEPDAPLRPPYQRAETVPSEIAAAFELTIASVDRIGVGHINETFVVTETSGRRLLVQSINHSVFTEPGRVMDNLERVLSAMPDSPLFLHRTSDGATSATDDAKRTWRVLPYIENTLTHTSPRSACDVERTATAFGQFQQQLAKLDPSSLHPTIPRFHDTPHRFEQLDAAIAADAFDRVGSSQPEIEAAQSYRRLADRLLALEHSEQVPQRVVHNDAKIANVLFSDATGEPVCVVDLDTVMAGLSLFDFGDMVRSMCHTTAEDERDLSQVRADPVLYGALAKGYRDSTRDLLSEVEREHLFDAGVVLVLEQGVRFLTDHLDGDRYFRRRREGHNLDRARSHFQLLQSLLEQERVFRRL